MNIAVTIFYSLAGAWIVILTTFAIIKRIKLKKQQKQLEKELKENENETTKVDNSIKD